MVWKPSFEVLQRDGCQTPESPSAKLFFWTCVRFLKTLAINPASLLPDDPEEPIQNCIEVTDAVLTDVLPSSPDEVLYTDGSSYVQDGV